MDCDLSLHRVIGKGDAYPSYTYTDRPSEWPDIAGDIGPTDEKMVGLFRVNNNDINFCSLLCLTSSGTYSVDWGDGTSTTGIASNTRADHTYSYSDTDLTSTTYGYKVAKVVVTPDSGNITSLTLSTKNSTNQPATTINLNWLDIDIRFPEMVTCNISNSNYRNNLVKFRLRASKVTSRSFLYCQYLEYVEEITSSSPFSTTAFASMFQDCYSLQAFPKNVNTSNASTFNATFRNCRSLRWLPNDFNTSNATDTSSMFSGCSSLTRLPDVLDISKVINSTSMFDGCSSLTKLPDVLDVSKVTSAGAMFYNCSSLVELPDVLDFSSVTNGNMNNIFSGCYALTKVPSTLDFSTTNTTGSAFQNCYNLKSVPNINTTGSIGVISLFNGCYSLKEIGNLDFTNATTSLQTIFLNCYNLEKIGSITPPSSNTLPVTNIFSGCGKLLEIPSGFKFYLASGTFDLSSCSSLQRIPSATWGTLFSINLSNCSLSATALNEIYTSLPTVTSKTIIVTGNPGVAGDTPSIATAKGWTVSG